MSFNRNRFSFADAILIALLLAIAVTWWHPWRQTKPGQVKVYVQDSLVTTLPLTQNKTVKLDAGVTIEVKDGRARIAASTCPGQHCVHQGWQTKAPVICVPNKVMLQFEVESKRQMLITQ